MKQITNLFKRTWRLATVDAVLPMMFLYVVTVQLDNSVFYTNDLLVIVAKALRYAIYALGTAKVLLSLIKVAKGEKTANCAWIILLVLGTIIWLCSSNRIILCYGLLGYYVKDIKFNALARTSFYGILLVFIGLLVLSLIGVVPNWTFARGDSLRYSLGYNYPTAPSTVLFMLMLLYFYLSKGRPRLLTIALEMAVTIFIYTLTDSRMGLVLALLIVAVEAAIAIYDRLWTSKRPKSIGKIGFRIKEIIKSCVGYSPYIAFGAVVAMLVLYATKSPIGHSLDALLSGRLSLTVAALKKYGVTLFGQHIKWRGWAGVGYVISGSFEYNYVDIAYMRILFDCGVIFLTAYLFSYSRYLHSLIERKEFTLLICALLVLVWGMVEPNIIEVGRNPFALSLLFYAVNDMLGEDHDKKVTD